MSIQPINPISQSAEAGNLDFFNSAKSPNQVGNFEQMISAGINSLNQNIAASQATTTDYILNKGVSTHELMISMEKAKHSMNMAVQVRNRLVESYQTITRMSI